MGELVNLQFHESGNKSASSIRLHCTKCASIIVNVIQPAFAEQLKEEIGGANFSIILDESTDVGCDKMMAYCIRYFNVKLRRIVVDFLGLQLVGRTTAKIQLENFLNFFQEFGLDLNKMIAIATDGASNLCGKNHSLYTLLKEKFPKLILMKCVCMSLFK